jgi:hypothetical protein
MKHSRTLRFAAAALTVVGLGSFAPSSHAYLLGYEGFDYTVGSSLVGLNGGYQFTSAWAGTGTAANSQIVAGNLIYQDSLGNFALSSGNSVWTTGDGITDGLPGAVSGNSSQQPFRRLASQGTSAGTTWISFMALRTGTPSTNAYSNVNGPVNYGRAAGVQLFYNATATSTTQGNELISFGRGTANADPAGLANDTWGYLLRGNGALTKASTDPWNTAANASSTADFILVRINHNNGISNPMDDTMQMWVNPILSDEGLLGGATLSFNPGDFGGTAPNEERDLGFNAIRLFAGNWNTTVGNYGSLLVDELKIGTTYGDVTLLAVPEPSILTLFGMGGLLMLQRLRRK